MSVADDQERIFRQYEATVLDVYHKSLPFWSRDRPAAVFAALAQFDCYAILSLYMPPQAPGIGATQIIKGTEEGLSQALKWLHPGKHQFDLMATTDRSVIGEAGEFCAFAAKYVDIADFHKMYGRGQVSIEVDEAKRSVRFVSDRTGTSELLSMAESAHRRGRFFAARGSEELAKVGRRLHNAIDAAKYSYHDGRVVLDDVGIINSKALVELMALVYPCEVLPLPPDTNLSGFSVQEFSEYFETLRRWSFCCTSLFLLSLLQHRKEQWECIPTQVLERDEFIRSIRELSGLSQDCVETITDRLSYDNRTKLPEVFQQPLFCGPKTVTWSPSVVQSSKYLRNMLKLMSRTKSLQKHAATVIGSREGPMLQELGDGFSRKGRAAYKLNTPISCSLSCGEVDLLMYNHKFPEELLVIEGKAILGVDEINEVDAATSEMQHAQEQLNRVIGILQSLPDDEKTGLFKFVKWHLVKYYFGVVVAGDAEPNSRFDHSVYPGISLQTINDRLRKNHLASPKKFWTACKERPWLGELGSCRRSYNSIQVGDVTYELPALEWSTQGSRQ